MATIYELTDDYQAKLDKLGSMILDGEDVSIEQSMSILDLQDDIQAKVVNIAKYSKGVIADSAALAKEIATLTARKKAKDEHLSKLKASAMMAMQLVKIDRIDDVIMPVRLQNSPMSVEVKNIGHVPEKYLISTVTVNKAMLLADKDTLKHPGVKFVQNKHIRFGN